MIAILAPVVALRGNPNLITEHALMLTEFRSENWEVYACPKPETGR
jgi:hypothetical protein